MEKPTPGGDADSNKLSTPDAADDDVDHPSQQPGPEVHARRGSALVANPIVGELDEHDPTKQQR